MKSNINREFIEKWNEITLRSFIKEGKINPAGKTDEQVRSEFINLVKNFSESEIEIAFVIDHTDKVLSQARATKKAKQNEISCLFYAIWFEHTLNSFIHTLAKRKGLTEKEIENIIRETSYRAKFSWLLQIFGERPFNTVHANSIVKLMEERNSFVHYKWKIESEKSNNELELVLSNIEKTVKYVKNYEGKYIIGSSKRKIGKLVKRA